MIQKASQLLQVPQTTSADPLALERLRGRVAELSEAGYFGAVSSIGQLLWQIQQRQEQIGWIATGPTIFYPPDLVNRGIDLAAITVVRLTEASAALQATEWLLKSGAFGLVLVDWALGSVQDSVLGRLARVTEAQQACLLFLTQAGPTASPLGSQVSLRSRLSLTAAGEALLEVVKDKRSGPASKLRVRFDGPDCLY